MPNIEELKPQMLVINTSSNETQGSVCVGLTAMSVCLSIGTPWQGRLNSFCKVVTCKQRAQENI